MKSQKSESLKASEFIKTQTKNLYDVKEINTSESEVLDYKII